MLETLPVRTYFEENERVERIILEQSEKISFDLFCDRIFIHRKIGEYLVDETLCFIANKYDAYILSNPVNPCSYAHFIRPDVESKDYSIRKRTIRTGISNGFLEPDIAEFSVKPLQFLIGEEVFYAQAKHGEEYLVKSPIDPEHNIPVACYETGKYIISDLDLIAVYLKSGTREHVFDSEYGEITEEELMIVKDINRYFQELIFDRFPKFVPGPFKLVAHGPANRFSNSKSSHIHYPLKVYTPHQKVEYLGSDNSISNFLDFNQKIESLGYFVYLNPKWDF